MKSKMPDPADEFFTTGIEKYLDATSAVTMFEKEVQRRVKKVVRSHQPALAKLFGEDWVLKDYSQPSPPADMSLGQKVTFKGSGALYFYFCFERDETDQPYLYPMAEFDRLQKTLLSRLWTAVERIRTRTPKLKAEDYRFYWEPDVPSNDWPSCEKALDAVIRDWIKLWQKLGGLPKYLPGKAG